MVFGAPVVPRCQNWNPPLLLLLPAGAVVVPPLPDKAEEEEEDAADAAFNFDPILDAVGEDPGLDEDASSSAATSPASLARVSRAVLLPRV